MPLLIKNKLNSDVALRDRGFVKVFNLLSQDETGCNNVSLVTIEIPPQKKSLKHFHPNMHELFFVLKGSVIINVDDEEKRMNAGDAVIVDPDSTRSLYNDSNETTELVIVCSPAYNDDCSVFLEE